MTRTWLRGSGRLWVLAAALGAATLYSLVITIHDSYTQRLAVGAIITDVAHDVAHTASSRAERLALQAFAPVLAKPATQDWTTTLQAVSGESRHARECRCLDTLPAYGFFYIQLPTTGENTGSIHGDRNVPPWPVLEGIAAHDMQRARTVSPPAMHVTVSRALGDDAVLTIVDVDGHGTPTGVYGLAARAPDLMAAILRGLPVGDRADTNTGLVRLRAHAVQVAATDSTPVFGSLDSTAQVRAMIVPSGILEGMVIRVAARGRNIQPAVMMPVSHQRLLHSGVLILCTLVAIIIAGGSSRREALLARARSDFIAGVSHDLRMPLAQVLLAGETLAQPRDVSTTERTTLSNTIVRETQRLIALVENVLFFSRTGAVEMRARIAPFDAASLLRDVAEAVELTVRDARQSLVVELSPPARALGDPRLVRQALVNLVDNAVKYGPAGQTVRLRVEPAHGSRNGDGAVRFVVVDDGPGVPERERRAVFEPYNRLDRDQTSSRTGAGLGLAVVEQIARACGGRVWLEGRDGERGTRAVLELRAAASAEPASVAIDA
jgi:signal transduction histidine kinase